MLEDLTNERVSFVHGFVQERSRVRVIARMDDLAEQGLAASTLLMWAGEDRGWRHFDLGWTAIRIACSSKAMFAIGSTGRVLVADASGIREEQIDGPTERGELRDLHLVDDQPYAAGDAGQVYCRQGEQNWSRLDKGLAGADEPPALQSLDSADDGTLYATGRGGQIWRMDDRHWQRLSTPTEQTLHAIRIVGQSSIVAAGEDGVLLRGNGEQWEQFGTAASDTLYSVEHFAGQVYAAGANKLYALDSRDGLVPVAVYEGPFWTYGHLHAADGVLWSFGAKHLLWTADGQNWNLVRSPFQSIDPTELGPLGSGGSCGCGSSGHHH